MKPTLHLIRLATARPIEFIDITGRVEVFNVIGAGGTVAMARLMNEKGREIMVKSVSNLWLGKEELKRIIAPVIRGTALGSVLGILPGGGAVMAAFAAYTIEKKTKLQPGEVPFGKGNIRGVAGPEAANNADAQITYTTIGKFCSIAAMASISRSSINSSSGLPLRMRWLCARASSPSDCGSSSSSRSRSALARLMMAVTTACASGSVASVRTNMPAA